MPHKDNILRYPKKNTETWINWKVRPAKSGDENVIADLALSNKDVVSPYCLNPRMVKIYLDQWIVAVDPLTGYVGGAEHIITSALGSLVEERYYRDLAYLGYLQQVDNKVIEEFYSRPGIVLKAQPTCPGKGSLKAITDWEKENFEEVWIWLSVVSPIRTFCEREGLVFGPETYEFMNIYKGDYSTFSVGKWKKEQKVKKWDLHPVESTPEEAHKRLVEFHLAMDDKWSKGSKKYGPVFQTDPFEEAMNECLDLALYAKVIYFRIKALQERTEESR